MVAVKQFPTNGDRSVVEVITFCRGYLDGDVLVGLLDDQGGFLQTVNLFAAIDGQVVENRFGWKNLHRLSHADHVSHVSDLVVTMKFQAQISTLAAGMTITTGELIFAPERSIGDAMPQLVVVRHVVGKRRFPHVEQGGRIESVAFQTQL